MQSSRVRYGLVNFARFTPAGWIIQGMLGSHFHGLICAAVRGQEVANDTFFLCSHYRILSFMAGSPSRIHARISSS
jgi:hypothetical protein